MSFFSILSLSFALFGAWQMCHVFSRHIEHCHQVNPVNQHNFNWLMFSQSFALAAAFSLSQNSYYLGGFFILGALLSMGAYGKSVQLKIDLATSLQAVLVYSIFIALVAIGAAMVALSG